jgi:hypothetical protein
LYRFIRFFSQKLCICIALNDTFLSIAAQHWFYLSRQRHICHNSSLFWTVYSNFLKKEWIRIRIGSSWLRIWNPDPDPDPTK